MATYDVIIIGAGAAGLMCAATTGYQGKRVLVLDHANKAGKKILMSGGGRCNFTNLDAGPANFFSRNPHFCISALKRYTPHHFLELVERHGLEHVEKKPGQLFCADSAKDLLAILMTECEWAGAEIRHSTRITSLERAGEGMRVETSNGTHTAGRVVVATGGMSIPTLGATGFGYDIARQFGLEVTDTYAALVPFTLTSQWKERLSPLSGLACDVSVTAGKGHYREPMLITHRGLSGPAMLQASSWWTPGQPLSIDLLPGTDAYAELLALREQHPKRQIGPWLGERLPRRLAQSLIEWQDADAGRISERSLAELSNARLEQLAQSLNHWQLKPAGTEGWRTAEVTMGGVVTDAISQKDFSVRDLPQLAFIGEVLDVTGELGGYNFQWAWSSAVACGLNC
ncbi:NAD(P)/FAD-dependent oxidoreductase [Cobetia sp. MB87]|uniref:NAD(P)/FAD-dependent oxidoreductase n=1 Tax=Cobetia sp. MB87 TaxID=2588451 RepID=UPI00140DA985|nr:NAD(P)/FAD-dependent oxidoreductase [Cobetia sp. MB87]NHH85945.1 Monomeric sarcosine oxidase [Cobetia sp. MB87]